MYLRIVLSIAALTAVSACGGGGGGAASTSLPGTSLGDMDATATELENALLNFGTIRATGETSASALPNSGSATYGGAIVISEDLYNSGPITTVTGDIIVDNNPGFATTGFFGEVELTADFSATSRSVNGTASNFYAMTFNGSNGLATNTGSASGVSGTINLSANNVSDAAYTATEIPLSVSGNIGGDTTTGTIPSTFFANSQGILGQGLGTLSIDGTPNDVIMVTQPN